MEEIWILRLESRRIIPATVQAMNSNSLTVLELSIANSRAAASSYLYTLTTDYCSSERETAAAVVWSVALHGCPLSSYYSAAESLVAAGSRRVQQQPQRKEESDTAEN